MFRNTTRIAAIAGTALFLAACGSPEPEPVVVSQPSTTPIFAKDGTVIGQRSTVDGTSNCDNGITREEDLQDGDIDCSS